MVILRGYSSGLPPAYSSAIGEPVFTQEDNVEPVSLADAKQYLRIDAGETAFDSEITRLISAARIDMEHYLNRSLINRTIAVTMAIAGGSAVLPYTPVKSIATVTDANSQVLTASDYKLSGDTIKAANYNQLSITYTAGYEGAIPATMQLGILKLAAFDYEHKGDDGTKRVIGDITGLRKYRRVV